MNSKSTNRGRVAKIALVAIGGAFVVQTLFGGEDLADRPFVMSCTGQNLSRFPASYMEDDLYVDHAAGISLPKRDELIKRFGDRGARNTVDRGVYHEYGFLPSDTQLEGSVATFPVYHSTGVNPGWEKTGSYMSISEAQGLNSTNILQDIEDLGQGRVEHYYLTTSGELKEPSFHLARMDREDKTLYNYPYHLVERTVAAVLPSDAAYSVYYIEMTSGTGLTGNLDAFTGKSGWWVFPLKDEHRYQPVSMERGLPGEGRSLGPYLGDELGGKSNGDEPDFYNDRRANEDVEVAPCFVEAGTVFNYRGFFSESDPLSGDDSYYNRGLHFIGENKEALATLPKNPKNF